MESESTFVAPEGVYTVTEEHKLSALSVHTVNAAPVTYPTKLRTVTVKFSTAKTANTQVLSGLLGGNREKENRKDRERQQQEKAGQRDDGLSVSSSETPEDAPSPDPSTFSPSPDNVTSPTLGHDQLNSLFGGPSPVGKKKSIARPKHNMRTTSSTFITRLQNVDNLSRNLSSKQGEITFLFYNSSKSFIWTEAGNKAKEPLARIFFSAYPTCHDVNQTTVSQERIDVIIGFNTGDLLWFDPISSRYGRLNKQGRICTSPCTSIRWVPSSPNLFLVSHADGTILLYDKEREDGMFTARDPDATLPPSLDLTGSSHSSFTPAGPWNPLDSIFVTLPPWHPASIASATTNGKADKEKDRVPKNPVSHWRVSKKKVVDFVFSPDVKYVAAISEDGCLRVIDAVAEQLVDSYASYFGALTCVAWSPDGRYILTGGQDDLVTIYSPWEQRVIARCQGHSSFVSAVSFDDIRCDGRTYRFGSVGEDNKLILWDFSSGALHRPKLQTTGHHQRISMTSSISLALRRRGESSVFLGGPGLDGPVSRYHTAPSRNEVAVLQPVLIKHLEGELLADLIFYHRGMFTANKIGLVKLWIRPLAGHPRHINRRANRSNFSTDADMIG